MNDDPKSERRDALPPPRPKHESLVEIVKQVVNERLDSLVPMNEEQLEILRESRDERERRKREDAARVATKKRIDRWHKVTVLVLSIVLTSLEIYRATRH